MDCTKVEKAITERQQQSEDVLAEIAEINRNTTMGVDDIIVSAMETEGFYLKVIVVTIFVVVNVILRFMLLMVNNTKWYFAK